MRQYIDTLQDVQGNALVGAAVLVQNYIGGGNASIFSDNGLTPIATSTVTTGADGQFMFFAADGDYNLVLSKNSTVFKTQSPVSMFDGTPQLTYTDSGAVNAYAIVNSALEKALRVGLRASFKAGVTNTGASTFQYNGLAAKSIVMPPAAPMPAGTIAATGIYGLEYDGTNWQIKNETLSSALIAPLVGAAIYPQTAAEAAVPVTPTNYQYAPGNVLRYGTNTVPGTTPMTAAFQAAFNQQAQALAGSAPVYVPTGQYLVTAPVQITGSAGFMMSGDGMGRSVISKTADSDLFDITDASTAYGQITIHDLTVTTPIAMGSGAAFNLTCTGVIPSVTVYNVAIVCGGSSHFQYGFLLNSCGDASFNRVFVFSASNAGYAWYIQATSASTVYKFIACSVYSASYGVYAHNTTNPGIEGMQFYGCDFVVGISAVFADNTQSVSYGAPQFTWIGGHCNTNGINFNLQGIYQPTIQGALIYNAGSSEAIALTQCSDMNISGNTFELGGGTANGVVLGNAVISSITGGNISNNVFRLGAGATAVICTTAATFTDLLLQGNERNGGSFMFTYSGVLTSTTRIINNFPPDSADVVDPVTLATSATGMTLAGKRASFINLGTPGGSTTITNLVPRFGGDRVTLSSNSANNIIQHNGAANGFFLSGSANFAFNANYARITLEFQASNNFWIEISRD